MLLRSLHFIPAHRKDFLDKARQLPADALVLDLEDGVPEEKKAEALQNAECFLNQRESSFVAFTSLAFLRVNLPSSRWHENEAAFIRRHPSLGLVLPKVTCPEELHQRLVLYRRKDAQSDILLIEDAAGLLNLEKLCAQFKPLAIGLGLEDFLSASIHLKEDLNDFIRTIRSRLALCALAFNSQAIDTVSLELSGGEVFREDCTAAKSSGLTGKFTIHPNQIEKCNQVFSPNPDWASEASKIASEFKGNPTAGYVKWEGKLLSPPTIAKAILTDNIHCSINP